MRLILIFLGLISIANLACAGAWPRDKGQLFIAAGGNFLLSDGAQLPVYYDPTVYAEYGLSERLTVGMYLYTADAGRVGSIFFFASFPIGDLQSQQKFAAILSLGARANTITETEALVRGGLSWGTGLENGWLSVDASATYGTDDNTFRPKIDATYGHRWTDKWTTSLQLQTGQGITNDYYAKIAPSVTYNLRENIKLHLGAVHALTGDRGSALKFETWLTF